MGAAKIIGILGAVLVAARGESVPAGSEPAAHPITAPPPSLELDPFYKKHLSCRGLPVLSSERVADRALMRACELIDRMVADREDVRKAMIQSGVRFVIIGATEETTDIPEYRHMKPKAYVNERARGFGGRMTSCGEENILGLPGDPDAGECVLIRELARAVHVFAGLRPVDPDFAGKPKQQYELGVERLDERFDKRLRDLFRQAMDAGLWKETAAEKGYVDYWVLGVEAWFDSGPASARPRGHGSPVATRRALDAYDPKLAALVAETFRHPFRTDWRYRPPAKRDTR